MMEDLIKAGGPAFPSTNDLGEGTTSSFMGMTLRDYFAGQALIALMSNEQWALGMDDAAKKKGLTFKDALATNAYDLADAMIEARSEP